MPLYRAPASDVQPAPVAAGVACRCCPTGSPAAPAAAGIPGHDRRGVGDLRALTARPSVAPAGAAAPPGTACATSLMRSATSPITGRCGGRCPPTSRPPALSTTGRPNGKPTARPHGCTMSCANESVQRPGAARADRGHHRFPVGERPGDGRPHRPRLRRGQKDQRPQAAHRRQHRRPAADGAGHRRRAQDRDAAKPLLWNLRRAFPSITLAWADGGYAGSSSPGPRRPCSLTLEIVKRPDDLHAFKILPRRWVVERTLSWITRHRRTVRDYERLPARHETYIYWSMIIVMTRRLARQPTASQQRAA